MVTVKGRYPRARFFSMQIYTGDQLVDFISDTLIVPDPGENNPFIMGWSQGTYMVNVVFGLKPPDPPRNTLHTSILTKVRILYRIYHATNPNDPSAETNNPTLPGVWLNGTYLPSCPKMPPRGAVWIMDRGLERRLLRN